METLTREFNSLTPENAMKLERLRPSREEFDFTAADDLVRLAEAHNMQVRGHTLVWHRQLSDWLRKGTWQRSELTGILRDHIDTVVARYRGRVAVWDVVNEAIADDGSMRSSIWMRGIGPEYVAMAFRWAHGADPEARLFYNDYGGEALGQKSDAIYELLRGLVRDHVPIHGVGLQMHVSASQRPDPRDMAANMARLARLGLEVQITEMDVALPLPATELALERQAEIYRDALSTCLGATNCTSFTLWGFTDKHSWIPRVSDRGAALIFDKRYRPKPAYWAVSNELSARGQED